MGEFYTSVEKQGNFILYRGISETGEDILQKVPFSPSLYIRSKNPSEFKGFYGESVQEKRFPTNGDMYEFVKHYEDIPGEVFGNKNMIPQFIYNKFGSDIQYNKSFIRGAFIDIEVLTRQKFNGIFVDGGFPEASKAEFPVNAICQYNTDTGIYNIFTLAKWDSTNSCFPVIANKTEYHYYTTEAELLKEWLTFFGSPYPHYITGWNTDNFDIPYLVNRIGKVLGGRYAKKLSPWGLIDTKTVSSMYGDDITYTIKGIPSLDYINLYKKHIYTPRESYSLDFIAEAELGEHKKEFTGTHGSFFWDDPQGFVDYNLKDVNIVVSLDDKLQLIELVISLAYFAGIGYAETFSPIRTWDTLIYRECMNRKIAIPLSDKVSEREDYEGAYVFPTRNGMYKSIVSFDVASMYPNCNRSWNIGADTIVNGDQYHTIISEIIGLCTERGNTELADIATRKINFVEYYLYNGMPDYVTEILKKHNVAVTPNWQLFRTDKESIFTKLQSDLYYGRKADKKKSQEYAQREKELHQELLKRGLKNY